MTSEATPTATEPRRDGRAPCDLRPISIQRGFTRTAPGSVLIRAGETLVLCTASVENSLPPWMRDQTRGWVTAEYNMLPGSTAPRKSRERAGKVDGRTTEIQRLIGRSLRSIVNLEALGPRMITVDCDVLQADGGTRTLSITGGFIALVDAVRSLPAGAIDPARPVFTSSVAAVSLGLVAGRLLLDLDYSEDSRAEVDSNIVMTGAGEFVEVQGTAEGRPFTRAQLDAQLELASQGVSRLRQLQRDALGADWPAGC
ncbi:MAG: ribonuclease PH [Planctomycetota bacterium]|nr:ribonuclease PH [Planctomycetota bacterium]